MNGEPHFHKNGVYQWKKNENPFIASSFFSLQIQRIANIKYTQKKF